MKKLLALPFLLLLLVSCQKKENIKGFYVTTDTLHVSLPGKVGGGVKLGHKYYIYYWDDIHDEDFNDGKYLCIFNETSKMLDSIYISGMMSMSSNLIVRKDSILLNDNEGNQAYYLDEQNRKWIELKNADYILFEDENYRVTSSNFGEWGGATWFKDKKTGIQYETDIVMLEIRKINNVYYLFSSNDIYIVKNPKHMSNIGKYNYGEASDTTNFRSYRNRKKPKNRFQGVERIFEDTIPKYDDYYKSNIRKSFIHNDSLYFIFRDDIEDKTFIAKMHDKQMIPVLTLQDIHVAQYLNTYRNANESTIPFKNDKTRQYGMLEIDGKNIYLHYIKNNPQKK